MEIKQLLAEDRAVSPVIGVILMVAITVILAAVIGTFVLGLGQNVSSSPSVSFSFDYNPNAATPYLAVTHEGGDSITQESTQHLDIVGSQSNLDSHIAGAQTDVGGGDDQNYWASSSSSNAVVDLTSNDISAGDTAFVNADSPISSGETIRVVWIASGGDDSSTLASFQVPE